MKRTRDRTRDQTRIKYSDEPVEVFPPSKKRDRTARTPAFKQAPLPESRALPKAEWSSTGTVPGKRKRDEGKQDAYGTISVTFERPMQTNALLKDLLPFSLSLHCSPFNSSLHRDRNEPLSSQFLMKFVTTRQIGEPFSPLEMVKTGG